jgi:hypothetical protein
MTQREADSFRRLVGLKPGDAAVWVDANVGPYEAKRAIDSGRSVGAVLEEREERRRSQHASPPNVDEWSEAGFSESEAVDWKVLGGPLEVDLGTSEGLVLDVGVHTVLIEPSEAAAWRDAGFDPDTAAPWIHTGLGPLEAAERHGQGSSPGVHVVSLAESAPERVVVWGSLGASQFQLATLAECRQFAALREQLARILGARSWGEVVDVVGMGVVQEEFENELDSLWAAAADPETPRPSDWVPEGELDLSYSTWAETFPRLNDPESLEIHEDIATLATGDSSRVGGELVWWTAEALPEAARVARSLGMAFVRSQSLIDQATPA